jgi:hypothetical protein
MVSVVPRSFSMPSPSAKQELQLNEVSHFLRFLRCFRSTYPVSFVSSWAALPMLWSHSQGIFRRYYIILAAHANNQFDLAQTPEPNWSFREAALLCTYVVISF